MYVSPFPAAAIIQEDGKQQKLKDTAGNKSKEAGRRELPLKGEHQPVSSACNVKNLRAKAMGANFEYPGEGRFGKEEMAPGFI